MKNKIYKTMDDAVADIPDGVTILSPGFSGAVSYTHLTLPTSALV